MDAELIASRTRCPVAPVRVGLAGAGRWGGNYLRTLCELLECRLVGIADPRYECSRGHYPVPVFPDLESLLESARPDAVVIATPDSTHFSLARTGLKAGCDVLVEKPMALSVAEAETLHSLARERTLVLAVGQTTLYHSGYKELRTQLDQGLIGQPFAARSIRSSHGLPGSNLLWDLAPHTVALAVDLFGLPGSITAFNNGRPIEPTATRAARFHLSFPGIEFDAQIEWTPGPIERRLAVTGTDGTLELDELLPTDLPPLTGLCRDFLCCCRTRSKPRAGARLGVQVVAIIAALQDSSRNDGRVVTFEPSLVG